MKKRSIIVLVLAALILTSCNSGDVTGESSNGRVSVETSAEITTSSYKKVEYYDIGPACGSCNYLYDIRNYYLNCYDNYTGDEQEPVTPDDLKAYAEEKLDSIDYADETSVRGIYQGYGFEIIRSDKFTGWEYKHGFAGYGEDDGYITSIVYDRPIADGGAMKATEFFGILIDPSRRFVIVHRCYDYKILYEFFNGKYNPDEHDVPEQAELSGDAKKIYGYMNIQPPFYCTSFLEFDITGDGKNEYCYTVTGGDGFYRSIVIICDPVTENSYLYFSRDFDYSLEVSEGKLILTVAKGENCKVDMFPDQGYKETLVMKGDKIVFLSGAVNGNSLVVGKYKELNLCKREQTEDEDYEDYEDEG